MRYADQSREILPHQGRAGVCPDHARASSGNLGNLQRYSGAGDIGGGDMTTTNTWPGKPGVPLKPEKEGWHWVHRRGWTKPMVWWPSKNSPLGGWWEGGLSKPHEIAEMTYLGPCLTPDEATALQARVAELEGVRTIKPLKWVETLSDRGDGTSEHDGGYEALTPFGIYTIYFDYLKSVWLSYGLDGDCLTSVDSPSIAKSTAEADYSARIRAALEGKKDE